MNFIKSSLIISNHPTKHKHERYSKKLPRMNSPIAFLFEKSTNVSSLN